MSGSYDALYYHLVFSTKNRAPMITLKLRDRLYDYMGGIINGNEGLPIIIGGESDHVHILAALDKNQSVTKSIGIIKAESTKWIHQTFPDQLQFCWQAGYGAFTISVTGIKRVKDYINNQKEHHRKETFKEEFIHFLEVNHIPYDPRYIWN